MAPAAAGYAARSAAQRQYQQQQAQAQARRTASRRQVGFGSTAPRSRAQAVAKTPDEPVALSLVLRQHPNCHDLSSAKISAVEKCVGEVDALADRYRGVETVFLSNNNISSLYGFGQFPYLRVLSLANNLVASVEELDALVDCPRLQVLNLDGNPIALTPNYRAHVCHRVAKLRLLDNKEVSPAEKKYATVVVKKEETMLGMMYTNDMLIWKLERAVQKLRVHTELRAVVYGRISILNRSDLPDADRFDVQTYLQLMDAGPVDAVRQQHALARLRHEVRRAFNIRVQNAQQSKQKQGKRLSTSELWDAAFSEVMLHQQHMIARLLSLVEEERQMFQEFQRRFVEFDPHSTISRLRDLEHLSETSARQDREALIREFRETIETLLQEFQESAVTPSAQAEARIAQLQSKIQSLAGAAESPIAHQGELQSQRVSSSTQSHQRVSSSSTQSHQRVSSSQSHQQASSSQSHQRVSSSQAQQRVSSSQAPQAHSPVRVHSQPLSQPQQQPQPPTRHALAHAHSHSAAFQEAAATLQDRPAQLLQQSQAVQQRTWEHYFDDEHGPANLAAQDFRRFWLLRMGFGRWVAYTALQRRIFIAQRLRVYQTTHRCLKRWILYTQLCRICRQASEKRLVGVAQRCFRAWREHREVEAARMARLERIADQHHARQAKRRALSAWAHFLTSIVRPKQLMQVMADDHYKLKTFTRWRNALAARTFGGSARASQGGGRSRYFSDWLQACQERPASPDVASHVAHQTALSTRALGSWKKDVARKARLSSAYTSEMMVMQQAWQIWTDYVEERRRKNWLKRLADDHRDKALSVRAAGMFRTWRVAALKSIRLDEIAEIVAARRQRRMVRWAWTGWTRFVLGIHRDGRRAYEEKGKQLETVIHEQSEHVSQHDLQNLKLVERLHELTEENSRLQLALADREKELADTQQAMEETILLERSLRSEVERHKVQEAHLQETINNLIQEREQVSSAEEVRMTLEHEETVEQLDMARSQLEERDELMEQLQERIRELEQVGERARADGDDKLASAFEIAGSLRKVLDEKEAELAAVRVRNSQLETEVDQTRQHVESNTGHLGRLVEQRDARIAELEASVAALRHQAQTAGDKLQESNDLIESKNNTIQRLEYEVQLMSQREEEKTTRFLSDIKRVYDSSNEVSSQSMRGQQPEIAVPEVAPQNPQVGHVSFQQPMQPMQPPPEVASQSLQSHVSFQQPLQLPEVASQSLQSQTSFQQQLEGHDSSASFQHQQWASYDSVSNSSHLEDLQTEIDRLQARIMQRLQSPPPRA